MHNRMLRLDPWRACLLFMMLPPRSSRQSVSSIAMGRAAASTTSTPPKDADSIHGEGRSHGNGDGEMDRSSHRKSVEHPADLLYDVEQPLFDFDILITGYEPFLDHAVNPAREVAVAVNGSCDIVYVTPPHTMRVCYEGVAIPVTTEGSSWAAEELTENPGRWDGVIHLGFESSARGLRLETIAANVKSSEDFGYMWNADVPCEKEGTPFDYIHEACPCVLPTTAPMSHLDLQDLSALLEGSGHSDLVSLETWSRDAGSYFCNEQLYRTLHAIRAGASAADWSSLTPAMFVHLPEPAIVGQDEMVVMVKFIAQSIMMGTVGLLPESCR